MAENANTAASGSSVAPPKKCPECVPGLPGWMATFSDLVTLLLTFFVLLLSFAKTESAKYEAALGSIRNAFGGNVLKQGTPRDPGKSPDDQPTMRESQEPVKPFPIEFLTTEGILDKRQVNRASDEDLEQMRADLSQYDLSDNVNVYEVNEGIKVALKDRIYFQEGEVTPLVSKDGVVVKVYDKMAKLLAQEKWVVFVQGHSAPGESKGELDAFQLSSSRAGVVTRSLIRRGVSAKKITTVFYGDNRSEKLSPGFSGDKRAKQRRVDFIIRKVDLDKEGHKVNAR